jgi:hypothetical protein
MLIARERNYPDLRGNETMATGVAQSIIDKQKWIDDLADLIQPIINQSFRGA